MSDEEIRELLQIAGESNRVSFSDFYQMMTRNNFIFSWHYYWRKEWRSVSNLQIRMSRRQWRCYRKLLLVKISNDNKQIRSVIKEIVEVCRIQLESGDVAPMSKLCAAKLLKDLFDLAIFPIIDEIERQILIPFCNIIEYRCEVKSINRGSTLFLQNMQKCINF